jgi:hypothetical protein
MRLHYFGATAALIAGVQAPTPAQPPTPAPAPAATSAPPPTATTKVTDNVYIFRYVGHQAMFIVTPAGVSHRSDQPAAAGKTVYRRHSSRD